jgi:transcriptional regulator with XRE-family HTH domain
MHVQSRNYQRQRGATLTNIGSRKLNQAKAKVEIDRNFKRYTLEAISERTGLTPNTLSKIFTCSAGVDKRTLECCFNAFNLTLSIEDYVYLKTDRSADRQTSVRLESADDARGEVLNAQHIFSQGNRHNPPSSHTISRPGLQSVEPQPRGGQMSLNSSSYIDRPILESLCYKAIQIPGALLNIRAPKQMGKTSLMTRILAYASSNGDRTVSLNLQLADREILQNLERFLKWCCVSVSKQLNCHSPQPIEDIWDKSLGSKSNATDYFKEISLTQLDRPLVMAIDEIGQLFAYPDIAREFLLLLRTWSEQSQKPIWNNPWHKLRLITIYSTDILIPPSIDPSFLNTGLTIDLPEFTPAQVQELATRHQQEITRSQTQRLITLLGGHPYRLQLAFYYLQQRIVTLEQLLENSAVSATLYADHLEQRWWQLKHYPELWRIFQRIVMRSHPVDCDAEQCAKLAKMGLIHRHGVQASLACELFRPFFSDRLPQIGN